MIDELLLSGATICVFDPEAMPNTKAIYQDKITFANSQYEALEKANALIIATEWNEFRTPDFELISKKLLSKTIFDGRNLFEPEQMKDLGFHYESVGRKKISQQ